MDQGPFTLCFEQAPPNGVVAKLGGVLDVESARPLQKQLTTAAGQRAGVIVVDMSEVKFVSSTALGVLASLHQRLKARGGGKLRMAGLPKPVEQLNRALCNHLTIEVFPTVGEALAAS